MGCCNKKHSGKPISKLRYYGGLAIVGSAHAGALAGLCAIALPFSRYRKVVPFFAKYSAETVRSVMEKERIRIEGEMEHEASCTWQPELAGAHVGPAVADLGAFANTTWEPAI